VQVDSIEPTLKAPKTKRFKQKHDELLSTFAFKFNLRRFSKWRCSSASTAAKDAAEAAVAATEATKEATVATKEATVAAGASTRPLLTST